jgi:Protein of unknown function (DUF1360)
VETDTVVSASTSFNRRKMLLKIPPESWFWIAIAALTTWRLTVLICFDKGPFALMYAIRKMLYKLKLGSLIECFHCTAIYVSAICVLLIFRPAIHGIFLWLATAGIASVIERMTSWYYENHPYDQG